MRTRKLSTRIGLQIIREKELEILENDQQSTPKVETGVEKHEETVSTCFSFTSAYPIFNGHFFSLFSPK